MRKLAVIVAMVLVGCGSSKKGPTQAELLRADRVIKWQAHAQPTLDEMKADATALLAAAKSKDASAFEAACHSLSPSTLAASNLDQVPDRALQVQWAKTYKAYNDTDGHCSVGLAYPTSGYIEKSIPTAMDANADLAAFEQAIRALPQ